MGLPGARRRRPARRRRRGGPSTPTRSPPAAGPSASGSWRACAPRAGPPRPRCSRRARLLRDEPRRPDLRARARAHGRRRCWPTAPRARRSSSTRAPSSRRATSSATGRSRPTCPCRSTASPATGRAACTSTCRAPGCRARPSDEAERHWRDIMDAYEVALAEARPGVDDLYAPGLRRARGARAPTQRRPGEESAFPASGFRYSLGHGVGLEVHEAPLLGRRPTRCSRATRWRSSRAWATRAWDS